MKYFNLKSAYMNDEIIRVSISEAAKLFGVDQKTIRRAIKNNVLRYVVVQGRYKIQFESLLRWSQQKTTVKNKLEKKGIGQFVGRWKIKNTLFSPNPKSIKKENEEKKGRKLKGGKNFNPPMPTGGLKK